MNDSATAEINSRTGNADLVHRTEFPIGVIIPTFNRPDALLCCLQHLEAQTWKQFEVVVIDDGSSDDTRRMVEEYSAQTPLALRYVRQDNSGPARARNHAISLLRSHVCIMIGDDIFASPDFVLSHLNLHNRLGGEEVAGLGYTRWSEKGQNVTPFMHWLDSNGLQFDYVNLSRGTLPTWRHFYTSNLSLKTARLRRQPFHEGFRKAAMEDIELGYRMTMQGGLDVHFIPEAIAEHLHPTSVEQACRRMVGVGAASYLFEELWPQQRAPQTHGAIKTFVRNQLMEERWRLPLLRRVASGLTRVWCPNPLLTVVLGLHHTLGYRKEEASRQAAKGANTSG